MELLQFKQSHDPELLADALYVAAGRGQNAIVALLLDNGADIDAARSRGRTAIANAVWWERVDTVRLLVARGAALDDKCEAEDCCSWTPLMQACLFGKLEIVQILLDAGADPNIFTDETVDYATSNALMLAVTSEKVEVIRLLLQYGADVNAQSSDGESAIDHARRRLKRLLPPGSSRERVIEILSILEEWDASHREIT